MPVGCRFRYKHTGTEGMRFRADSKALPYEVERKAVGEVVAWFEAMMDGDEDFIRLLPGRIIFVLDCWSVGSAVLNIDALDEVIVFVREVFYRLLGDQHWGGDLELWWSPSHRDVRLNVFVDKVADISQAQGIPFDEESGAFVEPLPKKSIKTLLKNTCCDRDGLLRLPNVDAGTVENTGLGRTALLTTKGLPPLRQVLRQLKADPQAQWWAVSLWLGVPGNGDFDRFVPVGCRFRYKHTGTEGMRSRNSLA